jgi:hypothetical protein
MLRRIACGILLAATAALASACGDDITATAPTVTTITETFAGSVSPASGATHAFTTLTRGAIEAPQSAVGPDSTKNVGFSLGTFNPTLNTCSAMFDNPAAVQSFVFKATASSIGAYCVRIYDNGNITTDNVAYTYTITVSHPQ